MATNLIFGLLVLCASLCTATGSELGVSTKPDWLVESLLLPDTNVVGRITSFGYPAEEYVTVTQDGFYLKLQRIPHGRFNSTGGPRPVVLLQHGVSDSAFTWLAQPKPEQVLPFLLADAGFDVWLSNSRCNQISSGHVSLTPNDNAYWEWSWDELARYDVPAVIKFILQKTGANSLSYIGHSQGTTIGWVAFSENYEGVASRVNLFISLAPVVYLKHSKSVLLTALAKLHFDDLLKLLGAKEFVPSNALLDKIIPGFCQIFPSSCNLAVCFIAGCEKGNMDANTTAFVSSHFPASTSVQNMAKWAQAIRSGKFQMFDYGTEKNKKKYSSPTPPQYNPGNITCVGNTGACNVALYGCGKDTLGDTDDINYLLSTLINSPNIKIRDYASFPAWGHSDIVWGSNAAELLYKQRIIPLLKQAANGWRQ